MAAAVFAGGGFAGFLAAAGAAVVTSATTGAGHCGGFLGGRFRFHGHGGAGVCGRAAGPPWCGRVLWLLWPALQRFGAVAFAAAGAWWHLQLGSGSFFAVAFPVPPVAMGFSLGWSNSGTGNALSPKTAPVWYSMTRVSKNCALFQVDHLAHPGEGFLRSGTAHRARFAWRGGWR